MGASPSESETSPNVQTGPPPGTAVRNAPRVTQVASILGVVALLLGGSALAVSLVRYSSAGGPGIVVAQTAYDYGGELIPHLGHCQNVTPLILNVSASGPGTVVVEATTIITLYHTSGYYAAAAIYVSNSNATCLGGETLAYIDDSIASGIYIQTLTAVGSFAIASAGTEKYYLTGYDYSTGTDYTQGGFVEMVGVFYPSG